MKLKRIPNFWWDFWYSSDHSKAMIVVESDDPDYPKIKYFEANPIGIGLAEKLIVDLNKGRQNYRKLLA